MTRRIVATPAVPWALAAVAGAWIGWELGGAHGRDVALAGGTGLVVTALVILVGTRRVTWSVVRRLVVCGVVLVAGAGLAASHRGLLLGGPADRLARGGGEADLVGRVASEPSLVDEDRWWTIVRLAQLDGRRTHERVFLRGDRDPPVLGEVLAFRATARPLEPTEGFDGYLQRRHVVARVDPVTAPRVRAPPGRLLASTEHVRSRVRDAATRGLDGDRAGLAVGLVTGDTRLLSVQASDRMADVGLTHLVAVSGSNVAIVLAGVALVTGMVGVGARGRRVLVVGAVAWFVVLTRAEPSVLRAAVMASAVLAARARGVGTHAVHALSVAVLVLVAADPALAGSLGLLLSAAATTGVLVVAPVVARRLHRWPRPAAVLVSVTVGAQLAVAPVLLATVGEVPLASIPANLLAVPAAALASTIVGTGTIVALLHPGTAGVVFALADLPLGIVLAASRVPELAVVSPQQPAVLLVAFGVTGWLLASRGTRTARAALTLAAMGMALLVPVSRPVPSVLTVTAIDVGQGDAVLVEGAGARILVDGGPEDDVVASWLRRRGVAWLDLVVLTHPHADHAVGLPEVLDRVRVGAVWLRETQADSGFEADVRDAAGAAGVAVVEPVAGQRASVGGLVVHVLSPPRGRPFVGSDSEVNEMSLVLRVDQGDRRALLTGDAEAEAQARLLASPSALRAGLLKVPHHGSSTSETALFTAVGAQVALVSAGRDNDYGHPHRDVLAALRRSGTRVRRTDLEGTVTVAVPPLGSRHVLGAPPDGRRRPAAPAGHRTPGPRPDLGRRRAVGRHLRRQRAGGTARTAHPVALRWPGVRGDPGRPRGAGRTEGRARGLPRGAR